MQQLGTCVRSAGGSTLSAVSWVDGKEIWVQIVLSDGEQAMELTLSGLAALNFASNLRDSVKNVELM
jgi:hypothetical protein